MKTVKLLWAKWKALMEKVGAFQMKLVFSLLYYVIITPVGMFTSIFNDFLKVKSFPKWEKVEDRWSTLSKLKEQ